ncbi:MAG TPA: 5-oxoprolinase subunit PxpA [Dinghuibacter sp.]|uniref:5-oxoprolinase subunit PxpA n=1 Tax=Dinghuibacter sp. TaxID=2024697 RepID=UPI002BA05F1D|nr:5-oxoprolinase subunit PxpA [Dinghuibacter sp.]HTJ12789.1 5-oxoprolinase subunit PxpA [Dinghuibacter sp.]
MAYIDLNCDMGEGVGDDSALMPCISSANIACGYHAGDEALMEETARLALRHGVAIGAHPSYFDLEDFGRTEMAVPEELLYDWILDQIQLLQAVCARAGAVVRHVKPHGALYNMAARDGSLAAVVAGAVRAADPALVLYGLSGSLLISAAQRVGLRTASEVFADRTYQDDGSLTPRRQPGALITDVGRSVDQVLHIIRRGTVASVSGVEVPLVAETVCLHGDGATAVALARQLKDTLLHEKIDIRAPV